MPWSVAFMVVMIVSITAFAKIMRERYRALGRHTDTAPADAISAQEVRQLKERIQVLERVITDDRKSIDLDREIERLRDR